MSEQPFYGQWAHVRPTCAAPDQTHAPWPAISAGDVLVKAKTDPDKLTNSWDPTKSGSCVKVEFRSACAATPTMKSASGYSVAPACVLAHHSYAATLTNE